MTEDDYFESADLECLVRPTWFISDQWNMLLVGGKLRIAVVETQQGS